MGRKIRTANPAGYDGDLRRIEKILAFAMRKRGAAGPVSLALVDDGTIEELNLRYKGKSDATDVLAFELASDDHPDPDPELGEIVVSVDTARLQAEAAGITFGREVELLALHGLLHLLGMDDSKPAQRAAMVKAAEELLAEFEARA